MPTAHEVRDVMSTEPVTATRLTPFKDLVELFSSRRISAAPVLDDRGRVVGVVSRTDLLPKEAFRYHDPSRREQPEADTSALTVSVTDGVVTPGGELSDTTQLSALVQAVRRVEGVVDTEIHLDHEHHRADPPPDFGALY